MIAGDVMMIEDATHLIVDIPQTDAIADVVVDLVVLVGFVYHQIGLEAVLEVLGSVILERSLVDALDHGVVLEVDLVQILEVIRFLSNVCHSLIFMFCFFDDLVYD